MEAVSPTDSAFRAGMLGPILRVQPGSIDQNNLLGGAPKIGYRSGVLKKKNPSSPCPCRKRFRPGPWEVLRVPHRKEEIHQIDPGPQGSGRVQECVQTLAPNSSRPPPVRPLCSDHVQVRFKTLAVEFDRSEKSTVTCLH